MGGNSSKPPIIVNSCTDEDDPASTNIQIDSFCTENASGPAKTIGTYCAKYGGTYPSGATLNSNYQYPDPEWVYASTGGDSSCDYDDCNPGYNTTGGCGAFGCCGITGVTGYCTRQKSTGDPLTCCLRDYQCNGSNQLNNPTCFSDNNLASTCSKEFRAPDTQSCVYLLNQFCLGNIPDSINNYQDPGATGIAPDFTTLWVDPNNPNSSNNSGWTVNGLTPGTKYRTGQNIADQPVCDLTVKGQPQNCITTTWGLGTNPTGPDTYLPLPDAYTFSSGIAPCQKIFWRTLYGNQPSFKNNYYNTSETSGQVPSAATSVIPQNAACGALPFDGEPTPGGIDNARYLLESAVNKYISGGGSFAGPITLVKDLQFTQWVYSVCSAYPNLCSNFLKKKICTSVTKEELLINPSALEWCGCYLQPELYQTYENDYGISAECTPYCNSSDTIPLAGDDDKPKYCTQSVCIIDDVTINLAKTRLTNSGSGGSINFSQICNACSGSSSNGTNLNVNTNTTNNPTNGVNDNTQQLTNSNANINCTCIINGFNLTTIGASIEGGINISQACNGNAKCYNNIALNNGVEQKTEIDCHSGNINNNNVVKEAEAALIKKAHDTSNYWIILLFIILIGIIIVLWLFFSPRGVPEADTTFFKRTDIPEFKPEFKPESFNTYINPTFINQGQKKKTQFY